MKRITFRDLGLIMCVPVVPLSQILSGGQLQFIRFYILNKPLSLDIFEKN